MRDINMDEFLKAYNLWIKIIHKIQQDRLKNEKFSTKEM